MRKILLMFAASLVLAGCEQTPERQENEAREFGIEVTVAAEDPGAGTAAASIDDADVTRATEGKTVTLTATPAAGWVFVQWIGDVAEIENPTANPATFVMPASDVVIDAEFERGIFDIEFVDNANGSIVATVNGSPVTKAAMGQEVRITATPQGNFAFEKFTITGLVADPVSRDINPSTFNMPAGKVTVEASFVELVEHDITFVAVEGGQARATVLGEEITSSIKGKEIAITAIPDQYFRFKEWKINGGAVATVTNANVSPGRFMMPDEDVEIEASFEAIPYEIEMVNTIGGTVKASVGGTVVIPSAGTYRGSAVRNTEVTITAVPYNADYEFTGWSVSGVTLVDADALETTFTMPAGDVEISAEFELTGSTVESVVVNGVTWSTRNVLYPGAFVTTAEDFGMYYQFNRKAGWDYVAGKLTPHLEDGDVPLGEWNNSDSASTTWIPENDPCPEGWRIPTLGEMSRLNESAKVDKIFVSSRGDSPAALVIVDRTSGNAVAFPAAGNLYSSAGQLQGVNGGAWYWTSNGTSDKSHYYGNLLSFSMQYGGGMNVGGVTPGAYATNIRCVVE